MASSAPAGSSLLLRLPSGGFLHERHLWRHRSLLRQLVKAELRGRYVATSMGFFWSVIHPLLLLIVYITVFSLLLGARFEERLGASVGGAFWVYFCAGMLPFMWFSEALSGAAGSIVAQANLIRKNRFPIVVLPMQPILSGLIHFLIGFGLFFLIRLGIHGWPGAKVLALPLIIATQFAFTVGLAYLLATLNVFWRDIGQLLTSVLMIWMWVTPIFYQPELLRGRIVEHFGEGAYTAYLWFTWFNPMTHFAELYQRVLYFDGRPAWQPAIWISAVYLGALSLALWFLARRLFGRAEARMVEMV